MEDDVAKHASKHILRLYHKFFRCLPLVISFPQAGSTYLCVLLVSTRSNQSTELATMLSTRWQKVAI